jgi:hypothetical protein
MLSFENDHIRANNRTPRQQFPVEVGHFQFAKVEFSRATQDFVGESILL